MKRKNYTRDPDPTLSPTFRPISEVRVPQERSSLCYRPNPLHPQSLRIETSPTGWDSVGHFSLSYRFPQIPVKFLTELKRSQIRKDDWEFLHMVLGKCDQKAKGSVTNPEWWFNLVQEKIHMSNGSCQVASVSTWGQPHGQPGLSAPPRGRGGLCWPGPQGLPTASLFCPTICSAENREYSTVLKQRKWGTLRTKKGNQY